MAKSSSQLIFNQNKSIVLNAIRDRGPVSRVELTQITKISAPTVTRIVNSLISDHLVKNTGIGNSSGGRPPVILEFDSESCFVIGIEWGLTHIKGILANLNGDILFEKKNSKSMSKNIDIDLQNVCDLIHYLLDNGSISTSRLKGIGIAAAGYINKRTGTIEYSPVQNWHNINIKEPLEITFHVPVFIDHQSRVLALSEFLYGNAKDIRDFLFINLDYGLGAGLLMDGTVVQGYDGFSGELGHIYITPPHSYSDRICVCGKKNCLAEFVSGRGLAETAKSRLPDFPESILNKICDGNPGLIEAKMIGQGAEMGDPLCRNILSEAGEILGISISNITNIINPEAVILGGKLIRSEFFFNEICKFYAHYGLKGTLREISIQKSELINQAAVKGAAALVMQSILSFT